MADEEEEEEEDVWARIATQVVDAPPGARMAPPVRRTRDEPAADAPRPLPTKRARFAELPAPAEPPTTSVEITVETTLMSPTQQGAKMTMKLESSQAHDLIVSKIVHEVFKPDSALAVMFGASSADKLKEAVETLTKAAAPP